ncbi:uncharacterized protein LOC110070657 [Pogona vitticeps]
MGVAGSRAVVPQRTCDPETQELLKEEGCDETCCGRFLRRILSCLRYLLNCLCCFICSLCCGNGTASKDFIIYVQTTGATGGWEWNFVNEVSKHLPVCLSCSLKVEKFRETASKHPILLFCPIASRMGTDIENALEGVIGEQKVLLVVMHFIPKDNPMAYVDARQQGRYPAVVLTVNTRYTLQDGFYPCEMNETAVADVAAAIQDLAKDHGWGTCCSP